MHGGMIHYRGDIDAKWQCCMHSHAQKSRTRQTVKYQGQTAKPDKVRCAYVRTFNLQMHTKDMFIKSIYNACTKSGTNLARILYAVDIKITKKMCATDGVLSDEIGRIGVSRIAGMQKGRRFVYNACVKQVEQPIRRDDLKTSTHENTLRLFNGRSSVVYLDFIVRWCI